MDDGVDGVEDLVLGWAYEGHFPSAKLILQGRRREIYGNISTIRIDEHRLAEAIAERFGLPVESVLDEADKVLRKARS
jgi:hypothetical protein